MQEEAQHCVCIARQDKIADITSFYGFPDHYYKEKFPNVGSRKVADKVLAALSKAGIEGKGVKRGLDHGVWASFKCGMIYASPYFPSSKSMQI